jgi:aminoglycoside phosphotransferase
MRQRSEFMQDLIKLYGLPHAIYNPSEHPARVVEMGKLGYTKARMASEMNISRKTFFSWIDEHEEFAYAVELAVTHAQARAEEELDRIATGEKNGNPQAYIFKMKMQHKDDYTEVKQINTVNTLQIQTLPDDQLNKQIAAKLKMLSEDERKTVLQQLSPHIIDGEFEEVEA